MNRPPLRAALAFFLPPLEPRVRDMMVDARTQTTGDLALDFAQLCQHRLLGLGRVEPREISGRGEHAGRVVRIAGDAAALRLARASRIAGAVGFASIMRVAGAMPVAITHWA